MFSGDDRPLPDDRREWFAVWPVENCLVALELFSSLDLQGPARRSLELFKRTLTSRFARPDICMQGAPYLNPLSPAPRIRRNTGGVLATCCCRSGCQRDSHPGAFVRGHLANVRLTIRVDDTSQIGRQIRDSLVGSTTRSCRLIRAASMFQRQRFCQYHLRKRVGIQCRNQKLRRGESVEYKPKVREL